MKIYDYYSGGKLIIRIETYSKARADLLFKFAFSGTQLTQDEWEKTLDIELI